MTQLSRCVIMDAIDATILVACMTTSAMWFLLTVYFLLPYLRLPSAYLPAFDVYHQW